jgi:hypothetical protein
MIGVPLAWAILLLFHPQGGDGFYEIIDGNVVPWVTVHLGMGSSSRCSPGWSTCS